MTATIAPPTPTPIDSPHHPLTFWLIAAQYAIFGVMFAMVSVLWKDIILAVRISDAMFGRILAVMPVAGVPIMLLGGYLGDRIGPRLLPTLGSALMIAFCLTLIGPASIMLLLLAVIFQGVGAGIYDVGINAASVDYERRSPKSVLNAFHACFNAGAVTGAIVTGVLRSVGMPYQAILAGLAVLYALMLIAIWCIPPPVQTSYRAQQRDWRGTLRAMRADPTMRLIAVILCCGLVIEGTMGTWATLYLRADIGLAAWIGGIGYALFNVTMTIGRLMNQRLLARMGPRTALIGAGCAIVVVNALTLLTRQPWLVIIGFGALGVVTAGVFPTGFIIVGRIAPGAIGLVSAALFALAYIAWAVSSPLVGGIADALSLRLALGLLGILGALVALCALHLPDERYMEQPPSPQAHPSPDLSRIIVAAVTDHRNNHTSD
ncbi:MAG: MFS transporter [Chloroflexota bacterium]|nr:MFS transporter [Chloroflexota bacterium]